MLAEIAAAILPNEERLSFAGQELLVRELETAHDLGDLGPDDGEEAFFRIMVRCIFDASGTAVMTDADIPQLRHSSKTKLLPLVMAVKRVNGLSGDANTEKSEPVPV